MLDRLRENWQFRLIALTGAILLHFYVTSQPIPNRVMPVPITVRNLPQGLIISGKMPSSTMVTLTAAADDLTRVSPDNVTATIDLRRARPGQNPGVPVDVELSPAAIRSAITGLETQPRTISIQLSEIRHTHLPITVTVEGSSGSGYSALKPAVVPATASVSGAADIVDTVTRLVVKPDLTGATDTVDDDFPIVPVDAGGIEVTGVKVTPETAHVQIGIVEASRTKEVFVVPVIVGNPAPGYIIGAVETRPSMVTVTGETQRLTAIDKVVTEPVDVAGSPASIVKRVQCLAPSGGGLAADVSAVVTVKIVPATGGKAPVQNETGPPKPHPVASQ
jgi:YbbR domain-containing protein